MRLRQARSPSRAPNSPPCTYYVHSPPIPPSPRGTQGQGLNSSLCNVAFSPANHNARPKLVEISLVRTRWTLQTSATSQKSRFLQRRFLLVKMITRVSSWWRVIKLFTSREGCTLFSFAIMALTSWRLQELGSPVRIILKSQNQGTMQMRIF